MSTGTENLDTCGCCATDIGAAAAHYNRAGLPRLAYRIGTHSDFLHRMLHRLPYQALPDGPHAGAKPLAGLTTRSTDDPSIALLDAWAMSLDVLAFYQEQIINEAYLRTATERRSVLELARAIGYELGPGVAATTYLAFRLDRARRTPKSVTLPIGLRVVSVPVKDELPQKFETVEEVEARPDWNELAPRMRALPGLTAATRGIAVAGLGTGLQKGDVLLIVGADRFEHAASREWVVAPIATVTLDEAERNTVVTFDKTLGELAGANTLPAEPRLFVLRDRMNLFGANAPDMRTVPQKTRGVFGNNRDWPGLDVPAAGPFDLSAEYPRIVPQSWIVVIGPLQAGGAEGELPPTTATRLYGVDQVRTVARTDYSLVGTVTRVTPTAAPGTGVPADSIVHDERFLVRGTRVLGNSEELEFVALPETEPISGDTIILSDVVAGLVPGRTIVVTGKLPWMRITGDPAGKDPMLSVRRGDLVQALRPRVVVTRSAVDPCGEVHRWTVRARGGTTGTLDISPCSLAWWPPGAEDDAISEVAVIKSVRSDNAVTTITLKQPLDNVYDRGTCRVMANVARATHGETVVEGLGSGDGTMRNQRFTLKKPPLTYVPAANATGSTGTLEVRVNGILWSPVASLYGQGPRNEVYTVRINNEGKASVIFGDGERGARLPSGTDNIDAHYRSGIGLDGEVPADALTVLQTRPLGVVEVTNPVAADGAASPEQMEDARRNAPITVLTFERIVSLRDFEDFARAFAGVSKAQSAILWNGSTQIVHLTVAGANGKPAGPELQRNLRRAIDALRDPTLDLVIDGFDDKRFGLVARIVIDPRFIADAVIAAVRAALADAFSFDRRSFGELVSASDVIRVIQGVAGVTWVDLDALFATTPSLCGTLSGGLNNVIPANRARWLDAATLRECRRQAGRAAASAPDDPTVARLDRLAAQHGSIIVPTELLLVDPARVDIGTNTAMQ